MIEIYLNDKLIATFMNNHRGNQKSLKFLDNLKSELIKQIPEQVLELQKLQAIKNYTYRWNKLSKNKKSVIETKMKLIGIEIEANNLVKKNNKIIINKV